MSSIVMRKRCSSSKVSLRGGSILPLDNLVMKFSRDNPFLVLGVVNSRSNS